MNLTVGTTLDYTMSILLIDIQNIPAECNCQILKNKDPFRN